ncbi:ABC transporter substrate-binding protein [Oscillospiraceae bacterium MB08-C2-2]|nr:ABC transporter substrate-binding protein [Oscillospiraceae bacterium MB08-C2-2]
MKKLLALTMTLVLVFAMTACGSVPAAGSSGAAASGGTASTAASSTKTENPSVVKIGILYPLSGSNAATGALQLAGVKMAVDNKNAAGGIESMGGAKVELVIADSTGQPEVGVTEIERLIVKEKVDCLVGPYQSAVGASTAPVADRYGVPYVLSNSNVDSILENGYTYVFRANHANSDAAKNMVEYITGISQKKGDPVKSVFIINETSDWGKGMAVELEKLSKEAGLEVKGVESFTTNAADMSGMVLKLKEADPDVCFVMMYLNDAVLFTNQMYELGCDVPLFADGGGYAVPDYIEKSGKLTEGVIATAGWHVGLLDYKPEAAAKLNEQFKKDYAPTSGLDLDEYSASGWLNASVMLAALESAGTVDKDAIRDALANMDVPADDPLLTLHAFGGIKFGEVRTMTNQNPYSGKIIVQSIGGEYKLVGPLDLTGEKSPGYWPIPTWSKRVK